MILEEFMALAIMTFWSALAGGCVGILSGFKFPGLWFIPKIYIKPVMNKLVIPALIGMVSMGIVSRNYISFVDEFWPSEWALEIKSVCLSMLLIRGGLSVKFQGLGLLVPMLVLGP